MEKKCIIRELRRASEVLDDGQKSNKKARVWRVQRVCTRGKRGEREREREKRIRKKAKR